MKIELDTKTFVDFFENDKNFYITTSNKLRIKNWKNFIDNNPEIGSYNCNDNCYYFTIDLSYIDITHVKVNKYKVKYNRDIKRDSTVVLEHVLVAEQMLGRPLAPGETVHHIDKNKSNNDPQNLMVFASNKDHMLYHHGGTPYKEGDVWKTTPKEKIVKLCERCGKPFIPLNANERKNRKYCSRKCSKTDYVDIPVTKESIINAMIKTNFIKPKAAEELHICLSYLYVELKKFNLPTKKKEFKTLYGTLL